MSDIHIQAVADGTYTWSFEAEATYTNGEVRRAFFSQARTSGLTANGSVPKEVNGHSIDNIRVAGSVGWGYHTRYHVFTATDLHNAKGVQVKFKGIWPARPGVKSWNVSR